MWNFFERDTHVEESVQKVSEERLKENLKNVKPKIQSKRLQSHISTKSSKKKQLKEDRDLQIFKENQILMKKMIQIDSKPPSFPRFRVLSAKFGGRSSSRTQEQSKIFQENQRFLRKLQSTHSHYSIARFEQENQYREYLKSNICKKPKRPSSRPEKTHPHSDLISRILQRREQRMENNPNLVNKYE